MSSSYYRKKKHFFLKRQHANDSEVETRIKRSCPTMALSSIVHNNGNRDPLRNCPPNSPSIDTLHIEHNSAELLCLSNAVINEKSSSSLTDEPSICNLNDSDLSRKSSTNSENIKSSFSDKIHALLVRHISHVTKTFTTELLEILRENGNIELPKSATTLLKSAKYKEKKIHKMRTKSHRDKEYGHYVYFGIAENLKRIISPTYNKSVIKLLINIDGLPVFNHSDQQLWPILMLVCDPDYESTPFMIAAFCGKSKPHSVNKFLNKCITEIKELLKDGINIEEVHFTVEILGFVCDTPARSFLKCCKGHGGFYACERCEIKGISIENSRGNKKRVYANINAKLRTKKSFQEQHQKEHHKGTSPILNIPEFDPVRGFFLDSMHLMYIGVMKLLLEAWLFGSRKTKISTSQRKYLRDTLVKLAKVPDEFQRKEYDLDNLSNWKATQYRFFLHYSSVGCLRKVLRKDIYEHFMLFFVASRILCCSELAIRYTEFARSLLRKFVYLFPTFYGEDSQNIIIHNLIHLPDDVEYTNLELPAISAFIFENCLGWIKSTIRGTKKPLHQLVRRIAELHSYPIAADLPQLNHPLSKRMNKKRDLIVKLHKSASHCGHSTKNNVKQVVYKGMIIDSNNSNNLVQLQCGRIIRISDISYTSDGSLSFTGFGISKLTNLFEYPCDSTEIGIYQLSSESKTIENFDINQIKRKCVLLIADRKQIAVTLLHS